MAETLALADLAKRLDFSTVPEVWPRLAERIDQSQALQVSLAGVEQANSAALALLLEGLDHARSRGCQLRYQDIPQSLLELARMSDVEPLLTGGVPVD